jgi:hypothetical protein
MTKIREPSITNHATIFAVFEENGKGYPPMTLEWRKVMQHIEYQSVVVFDDHWGKLV